MKKIFRLFAAFAAITSAFSCMEEANPDAGIHNGGSSYDGPMVTLTFSVDELTKTSYDKENGHQWSEGDQIKIIWGTEDDAYTVADVINGSVIAKVGVADTYYAVYPETSAYTFTTPEGAEAAQLTVAIPQTQDGSFKQANIMAAKTSATDLNFAFKNLTHIFKFTLSEDSAYKGFQFMSNSSSNHALTGAVAVSFDEFAISAPSTLKIGETNYPSSSIVQAGNLEKGGTYYIGIYPGADMSYGFGFKATKQEGTTGWSEGALLMGTVDTDRLKITSITNLDQAIRPNIFFKQTACGTGDGSSWENAGDINLLVKLLGSEIAPGVNYNKNTNAWRLYGAKLHFAAGIYEFPQTVAFQIAVNNRTAVYGGYPTNLTGTSLEGRDAAANETIFTKAGGSRLFSSNGSTLYDWTWDGLTFTINEGTTATDRGTMFYFNNNTKGTLKFKDCIFKNVKSSSTTGGTILDFNTGTATFKATFENCEFRNNECTKGHGGAILIESGSAAVIKFVHCDFTSNTVTGNNKSGGAIYNNSATVIVDNCSFVGNGKDASGKATCYEGGAIYSIDAAASTDGTTPMSYLYIYDSYFTGNAASNQAGAIKAQGGGYMTMVNSTVSGNTTKNGSVRLRCAASNPTSENGMHAYLVNSTFADDAQSFYNQQSIAYIYNTVIRKYYENGTAPIMNLYSSVMTEVAGGKTDIQAGYYNAAGAVDNTVTDFTDLFGTYADGIVPVGGIALTYGMASTALSALATDIKAAMPLFDATKLTVDQKGNSREGKTIMGAYVGE